MTKDTYNLAAGVLAGTGFFMSYKDTSLPSSGRVFYVIGLLALALGLKKAEPECPSNVLLISFFVGMAAGFGASAVMYPEYQSQPRRIWL